MKVFTILLLTTSSLSFAQDISKSYPDLMNKIAAINSDKSLSKVVLKNEEFLTTLTDGGGELVGYFKNQVVHKISRTIGLSNGIENHDYYFVEGKLIFVYETFNGFVFDEDKQKFDYTKTELNFIGRYNFKDNKLIDIETTGHNRFEDDTRDPGTTLVKEMNDNLRILKGKMK